MNPVNQNTELGQRIAGIVIAALGCCAEYQYVQEVLQGGTFGLKLMMPAPFLIVAGVLCWFRPPGGGPFPLQRLLYVAGLAGTATNIGLYVWLR